MLLFCIIKEKILLSSVDFQVVSHGVDRELNRDAMGRSDPEVPALRHVYKTAMKIVLCLYLIKLL